MVLACYRQQAGSLGQRVIVEKRRGEGEIGAFAVS
jgi:hypothetical protein